MPATFHLIRHADKDAPPDLVPARASGVHLTERGRRQAEALASYFAGQQIDRILCSPLERARETAEPLARRHGREVEVSEAFHEFAWGTWTNRTFVDLEKRPLWKRFNTLRSATRVPGGETMHEVQSRFVGEMIRLHEAYPDSTFAVVSHGDPIRSALTYFAGAPLDFFQRFTVDPGTVSTVVLDDFEIRLARLNHSPAL